MKYLFLALIFILGLILRFIFLGEIPVSLHRDEAYLAYNAYSILLTGRDMNGTFLPLHLESFYFSPSGYSFASIPFIFIFGLNQFSARFASAIFGALTIPVFYYLCFALFDKFKNKGTIALISSFFLAVSPWHINLSRTATENVIVLFFVVLGALVYFIWVDKKKNYLLVLSYLLLGITTFIYQAPRGFTPLFVPLLGAYVFLKDKQLILKNLLKQFLLFLFIIVLPIIIIFSQKDLTVRISDLSVFNHPETALVLQEQVSNDTVAGLPYIVNRFFHNKATGYFFTISENFFKHLSFDFLFLDYGFPDRYRIPVSGLLYIFQLPLILLGVFSLLKKDKKIAFFLTGWIAVSFLGASLTFDDVPNLQRTLFSVIPLVIFSGLGFVAICELVKNPKIRNIALFIVWVIIIYSILYYLVQYYVQGRVYRPWYRQDGYEELVSKVNTLLPNYSHAVITDRETAPSIFFLFYGNYDPNIFQDETRNENIRLSNEVKFSNYVFSKEECPIRYELKDDGSKILIGEKNILYVISGLCKEIPKEATVIATIKRTDGSEAFRVLELK